MDHFIPGPRSHCTRRSQRGVYDRQTIHAILDEAPFCQVGFVIDGQPFVIPTFHWRDGDTVYVHGALAGRKMRHMATGAPVCLSATLFDGWALARSAFHHSMNFRSVVAFGTATVVEDMEEKRRHAALMVEKVRPGRSALVRPASDKELRATSILGIQIEEASAKIRQGPAGDDAADLSLPVWAGVIPVAWTEGEPVPA